jgi:multicomponent Na+:H+ antiporter subunit D
MSQWLVLPIALPFAAALAAMILQGRDRPQRVAGLVRALGQFAAAVALLVVVRREGVLVLQMGDWAAPFGISFVGDHFSALVLLAGATAGAASVVYAAMTVDSERVHHGYFIFTNMLLAGVAGAFLTGDLFNLYVWFEVMLIASFVLLALGRDRRQAEGATVYVTLNLIASATFLIGAGLAYALTGTLNFADLSLRLGAVEETVPVMALAVLLLVAFATKAAAFPFSAWLPASYHTPGPDVSALFAGLLTKVGVYAVARSVTLLFPLDDLVHQLVLGVAALTMVVGVLGALAQYEVRRLLSFHIASQVGYMLMGVGLLTPLALAGTAFYMSQHMVTKTALFLVSGVIERGSGTGWLPRLGGLYRADLALAGIFALAALSLAGIPPFAGFVAKFTLARAGVEVGAWWIVAIALAVSLLTLLSMAKIWVEAFWKAPPEGAPVARRVGRVLLVPAATLALVSGGMGLAAGPVMDVALRAGAELADPSVYVDAVLGDPATREVRGVR